MWYPFRKVDDGFDRLQAFLLNTRAGDTVCIDEAVRISGLSADTCRTALEALARAGLMDRETSSRFVRRTLDPSCL